MQVDWMWRFSVWLKFCWLVCFFVFFVCFFFVFFVLLHSTESSISYKDTSTQQVVYCVVWRHSLLVIQTRPSPLDVKPARIQNWRINQFFNIL